ncbi:MAG: MFS transporter [Alphaproteobacteria bacterium]
MSNRADPPSPRLPVGPVLAGMTLAQAVASSSTLAFTAASTEIAASLALPASWIGYQFSLVALGAMATSVLSGMAIARWGSVGTLQRALAGCALGAVLMAIPHAAAIAAGALLMGLAYGFTNPAGNGLIARIATERNRSLLFSIRQTGVPGGGVIAGLAAPPLALTLGWQAVPLAAAAVCLATALGLEVRRRRWDEGRPDGGAGSGVWSALTNVLRQRRLRALVLLSMVFSSCQACVMSFATPLLVEDGGLTLVAAGLVLSTVHFAGMFGRVLWGWVADRLGSGPLVLAGIAALAAVCALAVSTIGPGWSETALHMLMLAFGVVALGWNGVLLAEVARASAPALVGANTGAVLLFTFSSNVAMPTVFASVYALFGGYAATFAAVAVIPVAGTVLALTLVRAERRA